MPVDLDEIFKSLVFDVLVQVALKALFSAIPFLGFGPIGIIVGFVVSLFASKLFDAVKLYIDINAIAVKNTQLNKDFRDAAVKLKIVSMDKGANSQEFKLAREEHKKRLAALVKFA
jgi:hypothetical protein